MGNGVIGKILYFWIFIIGAMFFGKMFGFVDDSKSMIGFLIAVAVIYVVYQIFRTLGKGKREEKEAAKAAPVRKGQSGKKKKRH